MAEMKTSGIMIKKLFILFALTIFSTACFADNQHFISDNVYRQRVDNDFSVKLKAVGQQFFNVKGMNVSCAEMEALQFLYAYMPLADMTDYPTSFYLNNVRSSFKARLEMPWGKSVPEILFRHFVLPLRVNNENLDSCRMEFYNELKPRIAGLTMSEAILEVNHWCHEKVNYEPSDARTSSPLTTVRTAIGRCGEESTFTVAALRAVGIPARQVYTPRWAHTDDNHAWVEAWADGKWHFIGACEPEPILDLAWFNTPASRALLTHTRVFGHYVGPEEVMLETSNFTEINLIKNYANAARCDFHIVDNNGKAVPNAKVEFKIYNYGEFCTVATKYADNAGNTFLTAGRGDMIIWASNNGHYGFTKVSFGRDTSITIPIGENSDLSSVDSLDIVPPVGNAILPEVSEAMRIKNDLRKAKEDSIRNAYIATFINKVSISEIANRIGMPADSIAPILTASRGNHKIIAEFLESHAHDGGRALALLSSLSEKDLHDVSLEILNDSYDAKSSILCPRVESEMLTPYKHFLLSHIPADLAKDFTSHPDHIVTWCRQNIIIDSTLGADRIAMSPIGVWKSHICDSRSRDIFFVALSRTLGIDARKDYVTQKVQYKPSNSSEWIDVDFDAVKQSSSATGTLVLQYDGSQNIQYYNNFTISKIDNGSATLLSYDDGNQGMSWENGFKNGISLDVGTYILVTGNRLADGSVLATSRIFRIDKGKSTAVRLILRSSSSDATVIGSFDSESKFITSAGKEKSILSEVGRGYFILGLIAAGQEPSNHALRDIASENKSFEVWGRKMLLLLPDSMQLNAVRKLDFGSLPSTAVFGIDHNSSILRQITASLKLPDAAQLPVFIIADSFNHVFFVRQGYTIGIGSQLKSIMGKLK
jgi:hypothetical protein